MSSAAAFCRSGAASSLCAPFLAACPYLRAAAPPAKAGASHLGHGGKSHRVSGSPRVAHQVNRNMGGCPTSYCSQSAKPAPGDFSLGTPPNCYCYNSNVQLSTESVFSANITGLWARIQRWASCLRLRPAAVSGRSSLSEGRRVTHRFCPRNTHTNSSVSPCIGRPWCTAFRLFLLLKAI